MNRTRKIITIELESSELEGALDVTTAVAVMLSRGDLYGVDHVSVEEVSA